MTKKKVKQKGKGIVDTGVQILGKALTGTDIKYKGEKHAIMITPDGLKRASFNGPGTNLLARLRDGSKPISDVDSIAEAHDLRYALAANENDVRIADQKMLTSLNKSKDSQVNILPAKVGISTKIKLEDYGIVNKNFFTNFGTTDPAEKQLYRDNLNRLEQQGYGKKKKNKKNKKK